MATSEVYDAMAGQYLHGRTTTLFRTVQSTPIRAFLAQARGKGETNWYSEMKYLIVGPGPEGNIEEWINEAALQGPYLDEVDPRNIAYLDSSPVVLELCREYVSKQVKRRVGKPGAGDFVLGSGEGMSKLFPQESFDVIIAALCDHMNTEKFFAGAVKVLKPDGVLITSFPADGVNRVVREKIYQIPPDHTRFTINGKPCLVPSCLITPDLLQALYQRYDFVEAEVTAVSAGCVPATDTIKQASALMGLDHQSVPLVVVGFGRKFGRK